MLPRLIGICTSPESGIGGDGYEWYTVYCPDYSVGITSNLLEGGQERVADVGFQFNFKKAS